MKAEPKEIVEIIVAYCLECDDYTEQTQTEYRQLINAGFQSERENWITESECHECYRV